MGASSLRWVDVTPDGSMRERHRAVYNVQTIDDVTHLRRCRGVTIGGRLGSGVLAWGELLPGGDEAAPRYKLTFLLSRSGGTGGGEGGGRGRSDSSDGGNEDNGDYNDDDDNDDGVGLDFELWVEGGGKDAAALAGTATTTMATMGGGRRRRSQLPRQ